MQGIHRCGCEKAWRRPTSRSAPNDADDDDEDCRDEEVAEGAVLRCWTGPKWGLCAFGGRPLACAVFRCPLAWRCSPLLYRVHSGKASQVCMYRPFFVLLLACSVSMFRENLRRNAQTPAWSYIFLLEGGGCINMNLNHDLNINIKI